MVLLVLGFSAVTRLNQAWRDLAGHGPRGFGAMDRTILMASARVKTIDRDSRVFDFREIVHLLMRIFSSFRSLTLMVINLCLFEVVFVSCAFGGDTRGIVMRKRFAAKILVTCILIEY